MKSGEMIGPIAFAALIAAATPAIVAQAGPHVLIAGPTRVQALTYGPEPRQGLELFTRGRGRAPLIVYLHGGGWSAGSPKDGSRGAQADHFTSRGFAYATVAYRYVPAVTVEQQLADVARAVAFLRRQPGVDRDRIVLVGHSSGAHMAALLGSDPSYLAATKVPFAALRAVILLDPAVLDVPPLMASGSGGTIDRYFRPAFGDDPARQSALSPMKHSAAPNAAAWLVLHDANNGFAAMQSGDFAAGLIGVGAVARVEAVPGTTHMRLNNEIGAEGDRATALIDTFLVETLPETRRPRFR
jgi:arylformamidase